MNIRISTTDTTPIYQQIVNQVRFLVAAGRLLPGEEVPPIRSLAETLLVNPNTVARAYRDLQSEGILENRRTAGTFVAETNTAGKQPRRIELLTEPTDRLLESASQLDLPIEDVLQFVQQRSAKNNP